ncbi:hypothetical protein L6R53_26785 [Myxococcota bacterium]|nr:hypothetical protein [Myxococcota bacterium]
MSRDRAALRALAPLLLGLWACGKVPLSDVGASFAFAEFTWFEEEQTLFLFWEVNALQGLGPDSVIEARWTTDQGEQDWVAVGDLPSVHTHLAADCGRNSLCGSTSVALVERPRDLGLRLRYHRDGELALEAHPGFQPVAAGPPWASRSLLVYGVFDQANQWVQWRARHNFPSLRNEEVQALGLRRHFEVEDQRHGAAGLATDTNPYGYGVACPDDFAPMDLPAVQTEERAVFNQAPLPTEAAASAVVCAAATVTDATGSFTTGAVARKNPEVEPAFSSLRSPVHDTVVVPFLLAPCDREISAEHLAMQRQRLQMEDLEPTCIDQWDQDGFAERLASRFAQEIEATRALGSDMVLVVGLHRDDEGVAEVVEQALALVVPPERDKTSPRVAGAFVFDSLVRAVADELAPTTLWCPASAWSERVSTVGCAVLPDEATLELGPLTIGALPVLPSREQYLDFLETWPEGYAGQVDALTLRAPEFSATSQHVDLGEYGAVTFLDGEAVDAEPTQAFSWCPSAEAAPVLFRSPFMQTQAFQDAVSQACEDGQLSEEECLVAEQGMLTLDWLAPWHNANPEARYELGLYWDFPFLLRMDYTTWAAGSVSAFGLSIPFGLAEPGQTWLGTQTWLAESFDLSEVVTRCSRYCDHPTFDAAGVYNVTAPFRETYVSSCYGPTYPAPGDGGFPDDP